jgi:hypothetical protein
LTSVDGWAKYTTENSLPKEVTNKFKNLLPSEYLWCVSLPSGKANRTVVFLSGFPYGCCLPSLDIIALDPKRPPVLIFHDEGIELTHLLDLNKDGKVEFEGAADCYRRMG